MGNGTQFNTFSSRYINTGTGSQFDEAHFYGNGNVEFRKHDKARHMRGKQDNDANSEVSTNSEDAYRPYSGTGNIHVQDPETGTDVRISASGIHVKEKDGSEVHIQNGSRNNVRGSTGTSEVMVSNTESNNHHSSYVVYGGISCVYTGSGCQINGPIYGNIY